MLVGLGSMIFLAPLVLFGDERILALGLTMGSVLTICVNMPHFMASYRIVYRSKESILRHKWASIIVPGGLLIYGIFALQNAETNILYLRAMTFVSGVYLAWHYTGQAWGMMATYGFLANAPFSAGERLLIRFGLRIQLVWHVTWFINDQQVYYAEANRVVGWIYFTMSCVTILAFALVLIAFFFYRRRTGKLPPLRAVVAWLAICFWYGALARNPEAIVWVQIAHAVQYLSFPARVEVNNYLKSHPGAKRGALWHFLFYFAALIAVGFVIDWGSNNIGVAMIGELLGNVAGAQFPVAVLAFINIHHYFTDGVIWKISNKEVKQELFAHLRR